MNLRLSTSTPSKLYKHVKGQVTQEIEINEAVYPNLINTLKDCDSTINCSGINIIDKGAGYEVILNVAEGWSTLERDKGALFMYDTAEEGFEQLNSACKTEVDALISLL